MLLRRFNFSTIHHPRLSAALYFNFNSNNRHHQQQQFRFSSSSSSSPSSYSAIQSISNALLEANANNKTDNNNSSSPSWTPLRSVASSIDEDVLENVSEDFGGLKQFIEQSPEGRKAFQLRFNPESNVIEVSMNRDYYDETSSSSISSNKNSDPFDDISVAPPAPPPPAPSSSGGTSSHQQQQKSTKKRRDPNNTASNTMAGGQHTHHQQQQQQHHQQEDLVAKQRERKVVSSIPSFVTPLIEVVRLDLNKSTKDEISLEEVKKFLTNLKESNCIHLVDLFFPIIVVIATNSSSASSSLEALLEAKDLEFLKSNSFISILPPFAQSHVNEETDRMMADEFKVGDYDMCRLARYLSNDNFVSVSSLLNSNVPSLLQRPLMHVIAAYPLQFEYIQPNASLPEGTFVSGVKEHCQAANDRGCPIVHVEMINQQQENTNNNNDNMIEEPQKSSTTEDCSLGSVRFLLTSAELDKCLGGVPEAVRKMSLDNLTILSKLVSGVPKPDHDKQFLLQKGMELGLGKAIPAGMKRIQMKHNCVRSLIRLRFPSGNPFFNRDVFAHYLFDILPPDVVMSIEDIRRDSLPESGRTAAPMSSAYLVSYPHLFRVYQDKKLNIYVQRADSEKIVADCITQNSLTEDEIICAIFASRPKNYDLKTMTSVSTVLTKVPLTVLNEMKRRNPSTVSYMKSLPRYFNFAEKDRIEHFLWGEPPVGYEKSRVHNGFYLVDA